MTDKLGLYNDALRECKQRRLVSLTEDTPPRYHLDGVWDGGGVDHCLQQGLWNFAIRTVQIDYEPSIEPDFGYSYAFQKPADFIRLVQISSNGEFNPPLNRYEDERGYWWSEYETIYVRYVSNDSEYGGDLSLWTPAFADFVGLYFAVKIAPVLVAGSVDIDRLKRDLKMAKLEAKSLDAMDEPTRFAPTGSWVGARRGNSGSWRRDKRGY